MTPSIQLGLVAGDGIGPEIVPAAARVLEAAAADLFTIDWHPLSIGHEAIERYGVAVPAETLAALDRLDGWILGPHDSASYPAQLAAAVPPAGAIRKHFDLFANIRPARAWPGTDPIAPRADLVIVRENTEGLYADRNMFAGSGEFMPTPDVALAVGVITRAGSERIAREAFRLAEQRRRHVTIVHKANVLTMTTGLFRDVCLEVAGDYPDVTVSEQFVDAAAAHLVRDASIFDVIVTENLFGDILSDLAAELAGSLGIAASLNCSATRAMAQAAHGAAPDIAGTDTANPTALILSVAMLLRWLQGRHTSPVFGEAAGRIEDAIGAVIASPIRTRDLGGTASTTAFTDAVIERIIGTSSRRRERGSTRS